MIEKATVDFIRKEIKKINKEKSIEERINQMCLLKDSIRNQINDVLDDLFSEVDTCSKKIDYKFEETD